MNDERRRDDAPETESERRTTNLILLGIIAAVIGCAVWLGNAMLDARKADECISQGRIKCASIFAQLLIRDHHLLNGRWQRVNLAARKTGVAEHAF